MLRSRVPCFADFHILIRGHCDHACLRMKMDARWSFGWLSPDVSIAVCIRVHFDVLNTWSQLDAPMTHSLTCKSEPHTTDLMWAQRS